jgi:fluoride exporter
MNTRVIFVVYVALGGAIGTAARYLVTMAVQSRATTTFPWATWIINVSGSILLGFLMRYGLERSTAGPELRLLLTTGFCGGYTTFSTFSYETARLIEDGDWHQGTVYVAASVVVALVGTFVGFALARMAAAPAQG